MKLIGAGLLAHVGVPGPAPFVAMGLFFVGMGAGAGSYWLYQRRGQPLRGAAAVVLGLVALGCLGTATAVPVIFHVSVGRPSTTAELHVLSPRAAEVFRGDPATIPVGLRLERGKITPVTSLHLLPNQGHIHLRLDGSLVSMTGLEAQIRAGPGQHTLQAEFVAMDHGPFHPRVIATVSFQVKR
jgi:hypothetical protein